MRFRHLILFGLLLAARADENPLVSALATDDPRAREKALEALLKAPPEVEEALQAALQHKDPRIAAGAREALPRRAGLPPWTLTSEGTTFTAAQASDGSWTVSATRDGKALWQAAVGFLGGRQASQVHSLSLNPSHPAGGAQVSVSTDVGHFSWNRDTGMTGTSRGFGRRDRPELAVPEGTPPLPESPKTRLEAELQQGKLVAKSERTDGLGPWKVSLASKEGKPLWELVLPRGHQLDGVDPSAGTQVVLSGPRTVVIDAATGEVLGQRRK